MRQLEQSDSFLSKIGMYRAPNTTLFIAFKTELSNAVIMYRSSAKTMCINEDI